MVWAASILAITCNWLAESFDLVFFRSFCSFHYNWFLFFSCFNNRKNKLMTTKSSSNVFYSQWNFTLINLKSEPKRDSLTLITRSFHSKLKKTWRKHKRIAFKTISKCSCVFDCSQDFRRCFQFDAILWLAQKRLVLLLNGLTIYTLSHTHKPHPV